MSGRSRRAIGRYARALHRSPLTSRSVTSFATRLPFFYGWIVVLSPSSPWASALACAPPSPCCSADPRRSSVGAGDHGGRRFSVGFLLGATLRPSSAPRWTAGDAGGHAAGGGDRLRRPDPRHPGHGALAEDLTLGLLVVGFGIAIAFIGHGAFCGTLLVRAPPRSGGRDRLLGRRDRGAAALPLAAGIIDVEGWRQACDPGAAAGPGPCP